jgi:hypothetical protein
MRVVDAFRTLVLVGALPLHGEENVSPTPPSSMVPAAVTPLFNGRDLSGLSTWLQETKREDPRRVFTVEDGMIHISGDGFGYLSTTQSYRDYHLVVEFRWGTRNWRGREKHARDSGVFLHSAGPDGNSFDGNGAYKAAVECQVMQGSVGDLLLIRGKDAFGEQIPTRLVVEAAARRDAEQWPFWQKGGREVVLTKGRVNWFNKARNWEDRLDFRGPHDLESVGSEWTRLECICAGKNLRVIVNGAVVNEARDLMPSEGPILLQCEGSEIFFRKFELHPLTNTDATRAP